MPALFYVHMIYNKKGIILSIMYLICLFFQLCLIIFRIKPNKKHQSKFTISQRWKKVVYLVQQMLLEQLTPSCKDFRKSSTSCDLFMFIFESVRDTGCSLNIVFLSKILKYSGLLPFSVFLRRHCVYTHQAGRTPALQQNWQRSEN